MKKHVMIGPIRRLSQCHQPLLTTNTQQLIAQSKKLLAMPTECQYTEQIQPLHYKLRTQPHNFQETL